MKVHLPLFIKRIHFPSSRPQFLLQLFGMSIILALTSFIILVYKGEVSRNQVLLNQMVVDFDRTTRALDAVRNEDQFVKNATLSAEILAIQKTYGQAVVEYESLVDVRKLTKDTAKYDEQFAAILSLLSKREWASASASLTTLRDALAKAKTDLSIAFVIPANVPESNTPPGSGFSRQSVNTDVGTFLIDLIAADMGSTKVIVDTASNETCGNDCPVLSLGEYVSRNGAFAGVNGSYFCPADYPSCSGKKNSFDTLLMNKNKTYFNSDNNVYSTVPAVIFLGGSMRFVGQSLEWGRDTGVDGVIANQPLVLAGGNVAFNGDGDPKKGSRGNRSFVGNKGTTAYIGVVHNATVAEVGHVLKTLGLDNALNLDSGGSTALWSGGYKDGPGRNIPNAILFVQK